VLESYESHIDGRGMQFQALAAERYVASGANDSEIQPIDETVAIMGTLDEVRRTDRTPVPQRGTEQRARACHT
jgi:hypothetical protein